MGRWRKWSGGGAEEGAPLSESQRFLWGSELVYAGGFARHETGAYRLSLWQIVLRLPGLLASTARLAWAADRSAARQVLGAELGRGAAQAVALVATNSVLATLLASGELTERLRQTLPVLLLLAGAGLVGAVLRAVSTAATGRLQPKVERVASERFLGHAARVELTAIESDDFHRLLDSAQYGAGSARRMVATSTQVIGALLSLLAVAGVLTVLHPVLLPLLLLMTVPGAWSALVIARRRYASFHRWVQHLRASRVLSQLLTSPGAAAEVRVHGIGPFLLNHFRAMSQDAEREQTRLAKGAAFTGLVAAGLTGLATVLTYLALGWLLWTGVMALSVAGTAVIAIRTGSSSLDTLVSQVNTLQEESLFVADLDELGREATKRAIPVGGSALPVRPRAIHFREVVFAYPGGEADPALDGVTLSVPMGGIVALVGENGSGKTTLVKLLAGLYTPQSGRISWDEVDAAQADRAELFDRVGIVAQDFERWPFTARANVAVGRPDRPSTDEALAHAAQRADATEIVDGLPRGWDTLLARGFSGGHQLSGGQWQRLGITRAYHRGAEILIVDEPTAALDARAEQRVFEQVRALADAGQTVILITHRLASVRSADLVHVLDKGRLIETGTPDELLATPDGHFAQLYALQARAYAEGHTQEAKLPRQSRPTSRKPSPPSVS
ncbi:ABC transporter ATP-binding protein/permease [Streptomyces sp. XM4193]|uniref:ABC transporter ATP-binding protein n=1 Tax=Streptomyces sp. XM4193 TaxID=2929782 RepID=UPI001FF8FDA4|nr:ABC transporter ATP-binding protein [Streptomyces sp. XM4193]MCK1797472.1 ABC transporter ATP-binding protein/permease [Streptomyces sp. XM4193]